MVTVGDRLRWFHLLETHQVSLYKAQAVMAREELDKRMFLKAAEIEQRHIDNLLATLKRKGEPASVAGPVANVVGAALGGTSGVSLAAALRLDIELENRAMEDYKLFIAECNDPLLLEVLWSNCLDESLHTEWFKSRLERDVDKMLMH